MKPSLLAMIHASLIRNKNSCVFINITILDTDGSTCSLVYTGQIGYLREEINRWTMKFFVVKNINVFFKVLHI